MIILLLIVQAAKVLLKTILNILILEPVEIYPWGNLIALQKIHFKFNKNIKGYISQKPCHLSNDASFRQILGTVKMLNIPK